VLQACSKHWPEGQTEAAAAKANVGRHGQVCGNRSAKIAWCKNHKGGVVPSMGGQCCDGTEGRAGHMWSTVHTRQSRPGGWRRRPDSGAEAGPPLRRRHTWRSALLSAGSMRARARRGGSGCGLRICRATRERPPASISTSSGPVRAEARLSSLATARADVGLSSTTAAQPSASLAAADVTPQVFIKDKYLN
jgi:hypothetical protein